MLLCELSESAPAWSVLEPALRAHLDQTLPATAVPVELRPVARLPRGDAGVHADLRQGRPRVLHPVLAAQDLLHEFSAPAMQSRQVCGIRHEQPGIGVERQLAGSR